MIPSEFVTWIPLEDTSEMICFRKSCTEYSFIKSSIDCHRKSSRVPCVSSEIAGLNLSWNSLKKLSTDFLNKISMFSENQKDQNSFRNFGRDFFRIFSKVTIYFFQGLRESLYSFLRKLLDNFYKIFPRFWLRKFFSWIPSETSSGITTDILLECHLENQSEGNGSFSHESFIILFRRYIYNSWLLWFSAIGWLIRTSFKGCFRDYFSHHFFYVFW